MPELLTAITYLALLECFDTFVSLFACVVSSAHFIQNWHQNLVDEHVIYAYVDSLSCSDLQKIA